MRWKSGLWLALGALLGTGIWAAYVHDLDVVYAFRGDSAIAWVYQSTHPELFPGTFPALTDSYGSSLAMRFYLWAYQWFGIPPETFYPVFLAGEILALGLASWFLFRSLFPGSGQAVRLFFVLLVICSGARDMNLARFGQPVFFGIYYNYAEALRLLAVGLFFLGRTNWSYAAMATSFACHPVIGLIGFGFLFVAGFFREKQSPARWARWAGPLVFACLAGAWTFATMDASALTTSEIPRDRWFALTRFGSYHWYPWDIGVFTAGHTEVLLPFLAFLLLALYFWSKRTVEPAKDRLVVAGCVGLLALVPLGVLASEFEWSPLLTKLALHRSNDLVIVLGLAYVAQGLWEEIEKGPVWRRAYAMGLSAAPFLLTAPFSWIHALLFTLPGWSFAPRNRRAFVVTLLALGLFALPFLYMAAGIRVPWESHAYLGPMWLALAMLGLAAAMAAIRKFAGAAGDRWPAFAKAVPFALLLAPLPWFYSYHQDRPFVGKRMDLARQYKETQLWARANTPQDALFMPDQTIFYGWKDFSRRSSFGNARSWLFESWSYSANAEAYREGLRRFAEFGVDLDEFLGNRPAITGMHRMIDRVAERYYEVGDDWRAEMARRYGIDYFVYRKDRLRSATDLPVAYENEGFVVLRAAGE